MHEVGLARALVAKADAVVAGESSQHASVVTVRVGAMSHVSADHLHGHFTEIAKGTAVERAELVIEKGEDLTAPEAMDVLLISVEIS